MKKLNEEEGLPANELGPALRPFQIMSPQDMSSQWKSLCLGGSSSNSTYFCHCCMVHRDLRGTQPSMHTGVLVVLVTSWENGSR